MTNQAHHATTRAAKPQINPRRRRRRRCDDASLGSDPATLWGQGERRARRLRAERDNPSPTVSSTVASPAGTHTAAPVAARPPREDVGVVLPGGGVVVDGGGGGGFSVLDDDTNPQRTPFAVNVWVPVVSAGIVVVIENDPVLSDVVLPSTIGGGCISTTTVVFAPKPLPVRVTVSPGWALSGCAAMTQNCPGG